MNKYSLLLAGCFFVFSSCGDSNSSGLGFGGLGGPGGSSTCNAYRAHLQSCGLIPSGSTFSCDEPTDESETCLAGCMVKASCADVKTALCGGGYYSYSSPTLSSCTSACSAGTFHCRSGESVPASYKCDGADDCSDGSDEVGCPSSTFHCGSGESVPVSYKCDGARDCSDGSDEVGCPTFKCANGETIPLRWRCDGGSPDCYDGSDEVNCPPDLTSILICY
jgi:hypothetical protein